MNVERIPMPNDPNWRLPEVPAFTLTSPDFRNGDFLPQWARGRDAGGEDRSPTLHWEGAPSGTRSFVVTVFDPDAPTSSGWWHWAVFNIPSSVDSLPPGAGNPEAKLLPPGAVSLPNETRQRRFQGAAPPVGHGEHRYFFTVSALDVERLELDDESTPAKLGGAMRLHVIARAQLFGLAETPS
jgi:Raf kinase inhibitor-like YbhB/YbcL family protein